MFFCVRDDKVVELIVQFQIQEEDCDLVHYQLQPYPCIVQAVEVRRLLHAQLLGIGHYVVFLSHKAFGLRLQAPHHKRELVQLHSKSANVPSFVLRIHGILLNQTVALCSVLDSCLAVALKCLEASEKDARCQHQSQIGSLGAFFGLEKVLNRFVALL